MTDQTTEPNLEYDRPPTRAEVVARREAARRREIGEIAERLRLRALRVRRDRPDHGALAVVGVRVDELEALLVDRARLEIRASAIRGLLDLDEPSPGEVRTG